MRPEDALSNLSGQRPEDALGTPQILSNICGQRVARTGLPCQLKPGHLAKCGMSQEVEDQCQRLKGAQDTVNLDGMVDLRGVPVNIRVSDDGCTLWVNGPTHCLLRVSDIPRLQVDLPGHRTVSYAGGNIQSSIGSGGS